MNPCYCLPRFSSFHALIALLALTVAVQAQAPRKDATEATKAANARLLDQLPFSDTSDFENAKKGLVAPLPSEMIKDQAGNLVWDPTKYGFIKEGEKAPDTVNPSLWRQSQLINMSGLFKVADGIYQVRNLDLLVLDELGYVPASKVGSELLFDASNTAYERTSLIVTTKLPFDRWTEVLLDASLTAAALDRLTHRCHIVQTGSESYRLKEAKRRRIAPNGSDREGRPSRTEFVNESRVPERSSTVDDPSSSR